MAKKKSSVRNKAASHKFIIGSARGIAEAKRIFEANDARRSSSDTLLKPDDIAGEYDVGRLLYTTFGMKPGESRELTINDLRQFDFISKQVAGRLKKGVTAKTVIDLSLPEDRERANKEIKTAVPISTIGGQIRFMTNAGPNSDRYRHYVVVNILNFLPVVASAIKVEKTGQELSKSHLQMSCDCGRWRFWLAYLATKAGYNSGYTEDAFPKIRNPGLAGIACKHILRVMGLISQSPYMKQYMTNMVKKARQVVESKREDEKVAAAREAAKEMSKESWRQRTIRTTEEKRAERARAREREALHKKIKEAARTQKKPAATRKIEAALTSGEMSQADLEVMRRYGFTDKQIAEKLNG